MLNERRGDPRSNEVVARIHTHDPKLNTFSLGCAGCLHYDTCGGLAVEASLMDCLELCCGTPSKCTVVCPTDAARFARQSREVRGFDLGNVPRAPQILRCLSDDVAVLVYHGSRRTTPLRATTVALRLHDLIDFKHHAVRFASRTELREAFKIDPVSTIIVSGVDHDHRIEPWWTLGADRLPILCDLAALGIAIATTPNFSVLLDRPRMDDMHAMKRIGICFAEFQQAGIACALHPNGRTAKDFARWGTFLAERPEIETLAYEFTTGPSLKDRKPFHLASLVSLVKAAGRELDIVVRGDPDVIPFLRPHFRRVLYVETMAFMKTQKRHVAVRVANADLRWEPAPTQVNAPLDRLLQHNADEQAAYLRMKYYDGIAYRTAA